MFASTTRLIDDPGLERQADQIAGAAAPVTASATRRRAPTGGGRLDLEPYPYEGLFGRDLSQVRIHTGPPASQSARSLSARAYTVGSDIFFGAGQYAPESSVGHRLLTHELTHVVQQTQPARTRAGGPCITPGAIGIQRQHLHVMEPLPPLEPVVAEPVLIRFDPVRPWIYWVESESSPAAISYELYGGDLTMFIQEDRRGTGINETIRSGRAGGRTRYVGIPHLFVPEYRAMFHANMERELAEDVRNVKNKLLEERIDGDDERQLMNWTRWWAENAGDLRREDGRSYFDEFLSRLQRSTWSRDYLFFRGSSHNYLDTLYEEVEEKEGELMSIIARHSVEFGAYRPAWLSFSQSGIPRDYEYRINQRFVGRATNLVLGRLSGYTSGDDSRVIADAMTGLPAPEQSQVLRQMMGRYDERNWLGLGRYGEAWEGGMLYWLFEDLDSGDRRRLADSLRSNQVLNTRTIDALVAGRGWFGRNLPWTSRKAQEATEFWADLAENEEGVLSGVAHVMGTFSSLWLPETGLHTVLTLAGARFLPALAQTHRIIGSVIAVGGTGLVTFNTTLAIQELMTNRNAWTGEPLNAEDRIGRILMAGSGVLLIGTMAVSIAAATPGRGGQPVTRVQGVRRLSPEEVTEFHRNYVRVRVPGLEDGTDLFVPRGSDASRMANAAGMAGDTALVPVSNPSVLTPQQPLTFSGVTGRPTMPPVGTWVPLRLQPGLTFSSGPRLLPPATGPRLLPSATQPPALTSGGTLASHLSNQSLNHIESIYGVEVRNATAAVRSVDDLNDVALSLGGRRTQYLGTVGELLSADQAMFANRHVHRPHGRSNEPGPDVPTASRTGLPEIILREVKVGASPSPYRVGESGLPVAYRDPVGLNEYIWGIITNRNLPIAMRARFKLALDAGNIRWQLDAYGNVRVKLSGSDQFPGDIVVTTPIRFPLE